MTTAPAAPPESLPPLRALRARLTGEPRHLYAAAVLRIGYGFLHLVFLLREFPHRQEIWGPQAPWSPGLARELFEETGWWSVLTLSDSRPYFEICYAAAVVVSVLFMLGWRTRVTSLLFAVVVASFHARAIFMSDGGDNLVLLMALYLSCVASGRRWSLDAGRAARRAVTGADRTARPPRWRGAGPARQILICRRELVAALHNCALLVIAAQVCVLYGAAGLFKVQGSMWDNGTALHYVLNLELFRPWPALSALVDSHAVLDTVICYLTVLTQLAFPFVLFGRLKYPVLVLMSGMHLSIAVLMGLPLFSGAMLVADAVFLPDRFYEWPRKAWERRRRATGVPAAGQTRGAPAPKGDPVPPAPTVPLRPPV